VIKLIHCFDVCALQLLRLNTTQLPSVNLVRIPQIVSNSRHIGQGFPLSPVARNRHDRLHTNPYRSTVSKVLNYQGHH